MRPELVVGDGFVAVLFHTVDGSGSNRTAGNAVAVSFNRGATWVGPRPINSHRWSIARIIARYNGPGLRDEATLLADGKTIYFAYGDGRDGLSARVRRTDPGHAPGGAAAAPAADAHTHAAAYARAHRLRGARRSRRHPCSHGEADADIHAGPDAQGHARPHAGADAAPDGDPGADSPADPDARATDGPARDTIGRSGLTHAAGGGLRSRRGRSSPGRGPRGRC